MNNITFGDDLGGYYETVGGGAGNIQNHTCLLLLHVALY